MTNSLTQSRLRKVLKKTTTPQTGWLDVFPAVIGTASGTVSTGVPGIIYVRNFLNGQVLSVYNFVTPNTAGLQVEVGRKVETPGLWQVKAVREAYSEPAGGSVNAGSHTHYDQFTGWDRFLPFLITPIDGGGLNVKIYGTPFTRSDGDTSYIANIDEYDLSSYAPASGAKYVVIEADDDGVLYVNEGSEVAAKELLTLGDIPTLTTGRIRSVAIRLYAGQIQLYRDNTSLNDFVDLRLLPAGFGGGGGAVDSVNGQTGTVVLDADDIDDSGTTNKFATAAQLTQISTNQNDIATGWLSVSETWTYASADDPVYQIYVSGNVTASEKYKLGNKIKCTNNSTTVYGIIVKVGSYDAGNNRTPVDIFCGTDYDIANSAITAPSISKIKSPDGFPLDPTKWRFRVTNTNRNQKASPTLSVWYGGAGLSSTGPSIDAPIGLWYPSYKALLDEMDTTTTEYNVWSTLSTANNSESDTDMTTLVVLTAPSGTYKIWNTVYMRRQDPINLTSKTTLYLNIKCTASGATPDNIDIRGDVIPTIIMLECAYL